MPAAPLAPITPGSGVPLVDPALLSARREDAGYAEQQKTLAAQLEQARTEVRVYTHAHSV